MMISDRWWYFSLLNYFVSQENTKGIPLPQISNAFRNGTKLFSQNTPRWFSKWNKPHIPEKSSKPPPQKTVNDIGKIPLWSLTPQSVRPWDCEQDTMAWPLRKKKLCIALEDCSVLFSILSLTVPNHGYLRDISENICLNELKKKNKTTEQQ